MTTKVTVVGKNSFMAKAIREDHTGAQWHWISHQDALKSNDWIKNTDCLINFAYAPDLRRNTYTADLDIDTKLAHKIKNYAVRYIMLSSRMVYGAQEQPELVETMVPNPQNQYGKNKLTIEQNICDALGQERVSVLRLSNIFGFEPNRSSFFGMALTKLKQEGQITYDMSPFTQRDFMSVRQFGKALEYIAENPVGGIFNLGSGIGLETGRIAQWLTEGYGGGSLFVKDMSVRDVFSLNMDKTRQQFSLPPYGFEDIRKDCIVCGEKMKAFDHE